MEGFCYVISMTGPNRPDTGKDGVYVASFRRNLTPPSGYLAMDAADTLNR
jgi:hypothetical protein